MIHKLDIHSYGLYQNLVWATELGTGNQFKSLNVIFGRNYSGKTTLSRIFHSLETKQVNPDYHTGSFTVTTDDGSQFNSNQLEAIPDTINVRVFNEDFVKENLNWLHRRDGTIEPFTVLGSENIEVEAKIKDAESKLGNEDDKQTVLGRLADVRQLLVQSCDELDDKKNALDTQLRDKAREIKENSTVFDVPTYHIGSIRADLENKSDDNLLSQEDKSTRYALLRDVPMPTIPEPQSYTHNLNDLIARVKHLVSAKIAPSLQIDDLLSNPKLQEWARAGIDLHRESRSSCGFCSGNLSPEVWAKLDGHFNRESEELRANLETTELRVKQEISNVGSVINLNRSQFYSDKQLVFDHCIADWNERVKAYKDSLTKLLNALQQRRNDIFSSFELSDISDPTPEVVESEKAISSLVKENNETTGALIPKQNTARVELRMSDVFEFRRTIDYIAKKIEIQQLEDAVARHRQNHQELDGERQRLEREISVYKNQLKDAGHGAELVNEYLRQHFGHSSLQLKVIEGTENTKFKILRGEIEANNLSTGECSLIAFCYFMARIRDDLSPNLVVYIDDPISSLDSGHIYFVFSMIKSHLCNPGACSQLFVSTHNLDFLKYLKRLHKRMEKIGFYMTERALKKNQSRCFLRVMPVYFSKYVSEFNYLFDEIYKLYCEEPGSRAPEINASYNQFYNAPNNLRKFLEYYLFYKFPNQDNLESNLCKVFEKQDVAFISRIVNEGSHLAFVERGWRPFDIPEIERCVRIVVDRIKAIDERQYEALVESIQ